VLFFKRREIWSRANKLLVALTSTAVLVLGTHDQNLFFQKSFIFLEIEFHLRLEEGMV
jgi:hypothetical protein